MAMRKNKKHMFVIIIVPRFEKEIHQFEHVLIVRNRVGLNIVQPVLVWLNYLLRPSRTSPPDGLPQTQRPQPTET